MAKGRKQAVLSSDSSDDEVISLESSDETQEEEEELTQPSPKRKGTPTLPSPL